nr:MAG TPA: hypothetical protein [Caudoviricetes sp.]
MSYNVKYPNLELLVYQFKQMLNQDEKWVEKIKEIKKKNPYTFPEFDIIVFPQIWGSTSTAFDICEDGSPAIGGCAMTKAYTVVIEETLTETYGVFVDDKPCYMVDNPSDEFYRNLSERNMKSLSAAKKSY